MQVSFRCILKDSNRLDEGWVCLLVLSLGSHLTLDNLFKHLEPQFPYLQNGDNTSFIGSCMGGLNELDYEKTVFMKHSMYLFLLFAFSSFSNS